MTSNLSPESITQDEHFAQIKTEYEDNWRRAQDEFGALWAFMERDIRAYAGCSWDRKEVRRLREEGREALELPKIRSKINWFTGYQRDNIKSMEVEPVEGSDQLTADQFSKVIKLVWYRGQGQYHWNQAFEDSVKTGLSLFGMYLDLTNDPENGDIKFYRRGFNSFAMDPNTTAPDLSDCSWILLRDYVSRDQAKSLVPFVDDEIIDNIAPSQRDDKFQYLRPFSREYNNPNIITLDQYYRRVTERRKIVIEKGTGNVRDITDLEPEKQKKLQMAIDTMQLTGQAELEIKEEDREVIEYNILLSGEVVYSGKDALGLNNKYPFVPILCFFEPTIDEMELRYQGIVRGLVDAQRIYTQRNIKILDIMDKIIYGSIKYKLGSVDDPKKFYQTGTRRLIGIQPGYEMSDVEEIPANTTGINEIIAYSQVIDNMFNDLAGINETLLGSDEGGNTQVSGRLAQVRTANGVRANRKIFDQLDFSQKLMGQLLIAAIQQNYSAQKIERMINEQPTEQFYDRSFGTYDAVIKQGVESQTQQDQYYFELVNLKREGIVDVPQSEIIKALPLTGKSSLVESIAQQQKQSEEQQKKLDELELMQRDLINAQTEQAVALAQERRARVIADVALSKERAAESEENRASAALDRAKTMTEIQKLNREQIIATLEFMQRLQAEENQENEVKEADITQQSMALINSAIQELEERGKAQELQAQKGELQDQLQQNVGQIPQG